jgi:hypothetical protein
MIETLELPMETISMSRRSMSTELDDAHITRFCSVRGVNVLDVGDSTHAKSTCSNLDS